MQSENDPNTKEEQDATVTVNDGDDATETHTTANEHVEEIGGRDGLEPTRYGDWEKNGRCIDF